MNKTIQRKAILAELKNHHDHPTADQLYGILRYKLPQISLGTVYRNLEQLTQIGKIKKIIHAGHQKRFESNLTKHYHVRCPNCDRLKDINDKNLNQIDQQFNKIKTEINCDSYYFEFISLCENCQQQIILEQAEAKRLAKERQHNILVWK